LSTEGIGYAYRPSKEGCVSIDSKFCSN